MLSLHPLGLVRSSAQRAAQCRRRDGGQLRCLVPRRRLVARLRKPRFHPRHVRRVLLQHSATGVNTQPSETYLSFVSA